MSNSLVIQNKYNYKVKKNFIIVKEIFYPDILVNFLVSDKRLWSIVYSNWKKTTSESMFLWVVRYSFLNCTEVEDGEKPSH